MSITDTAVGQRTGSQDNGPDPSEAASSADGAVPRQGRRAATRKAPSASGIPAGCRPIAGMKLGWLFRPGDRMILHRPNADAAPVPIGTVPEVTSRIVHLTDDGQDVRTEYLVLGKRQRRPRILTEDELDRGTWAAKTGNRRPTGSDERHAFARLIREQGDKAPEISARTYYNDAGDLVLPDGYAQNHGYRTLRGNEADARAAWSEIGEWMRQDGKAALVAGAFFAGPVLDSLDVLAHMVSVHGTGQLGKSTILTVAAASFGDVKPRGQQLMGSWNSSKQGITQGLRQRGFLPVALDEHSASGRTIRDSSRDISQMVAGAIRAMGTADGSPREIDGFWHSVILSSSNEPLKFDGQTEDLASRLQEFEAPFFPNVMVGADGKPAPVGHLSAEHLSKRLKRQAKNHGGWPIEWAVHSGAFRADNLARLKQKHLELCARHRTEQGGIAATIAELHMAWVVGAHMLGAAIGIPELGDVAEAEAAGRLAAAIEISAEANIPDCERLWNELDALRIEAAAFPEMSALARVASEGLRPPKGFHRSELHEWWVTDPIVRAAADMAGIDNLTAALRELHRQGVHVRGDGRNAQRQTPREVRDRLLPRRMHCFDVRTAAEIFTPDAPPGGPATPSGTRGPTSETGVSVQHVGTEAPPLTCTGPTGPTGPTSLAPNTHVRHTVHVRRLSDDLSVTAPCRVCGTPTPYTSDTGPVHPFCADGGPTGAPLPAIPGADNGRQADAVEWPEPTGPEPTGPEPTTAAPVPTVPAARPVPTGEGLAGTAAPDVGRRATETDAVGSGANGGASGGGARRRHVLGALDASGLTTGRDGAAPVTAGTGLAGLADLAAARGIDRLFVYPSALRGSALPDTIPADGEVVRHPWADLADTPWTATDTAPADALRPWTSLRRRDGSGRTVTVCLVALCDLWEGATRLPAPLDLITGHQLWHELFGAWWFAGPPLMFRAQLERSLRRSRTAPELHRVDSIATGAVPAVGQTGLMTRASRPLDAGEDGRLFLAGMDRNAAWPTAMAATRVGIGEPRHMPSPFAFDVGTHGRMAGYWRISDDVDIHPLIDELIHLGAGWLTTGEARMLARGIDPGNGQPPVSLLPEIAEAWVWDESPELFRTFGRQIREARKTLAGIDGGGSDVALHMTKRMATATGALHPHRFAEDERGPLWRPDWADQIKGQGQANIIREVLTIGMRSGRWPVAINVDEFVYATDESDGADIAAELGMVYDPTGVDGRGWKSGGVASMAAARKHAGEGSFWPVFNQMRKGGK